MCAWNSDKIAQRKRKTSLSFKNSLLVEYVTLKKKVERIRRKGKRYSRDIRQKEENDG